MEQCERKVIVRGGKVVFFGDGEGVAKVSDCSAATIVPPSVNAFVAQILYAVPVRSPACYSSTVLAIWCYGRLGRPLAGHAFKKAAAGDLSVLPAVAVVANLPRFSEMEEAFNGSRGYTGARGGEKYL